jgi:hypothetical protein
MAGLGARCAPMAFVALLVKCNLEIDDGAFVFFPVAR